MLVVILCIIIVLLLIWNIKTIYKMNQKIDKSVLLSQKHFSMFQTMNNWEKAKQKGLTVENALLKRGFCKVAIYGMHYLGENLYEELKDTKVQVLCGIDRSITDIGCDLKIIGPNDALPEVDAVIVTSMLYFYEIRKDLILNVGGTIISIDEVIEGMC